MKDVTGLQNKVVIVTGAGKGIGFETAKSFCGLGCHVAAITRSAEDLERLQQAVVGLPGKLIVMAGDVSDPDTVQRFVAMVIEHYQHIDILINNAGMRFRKSFLDIDYQAWQHVMNVNLGSTFLFCQAVGRFMVARQSGRIINMASIVGTLGLPELSGYAASKGGIISLTKSLALEWAEYNVNVNVIAPGFCKTSYADNFKQKSDLYDFTIERTPKKAWGEPKDIADACIYLASDLSSYVTGEVLTVDGGWSAW